MLHVCVHVNFFPVNKWLMNCIISWNTLYQYVYFDRWRFSTKAWEANAVIHGQQRAKYKWITVLYVSNTVKHEHVKLWVELSTGIYYRWSHILETRPPTFRAILLAMAKLHFCVQPWTCCMWFCMQYFQGNEKCSWYALMCPGLTCKCPFE